MQRRDILGVGGGVEYRRGSGDRLHALQKEIPFRL